MQTSSPTVVCVVTSAAPEALRSVESLAREKSALDRMDVDVGRAFPGGVEQKFERHYRIRDYFDNVEIVDEVECLSFQIIFHVRSGADRYWKDAMAKILREIRATGALVKSVKSLS